MDSGSLLCYLIQLIPNNNNRNRLVLNSNVFVIAADEWGLVSFRNTPVFIIQNIDKRGQKGRHWLGYCVYSCNGILVGDYFDTYALPLSYYKIAAPFRIINS